MSAPKPILFVHSSNELYGSDVSLLELVRRLDRGRYAPLVVLPNDLPYEGQLGAALTGIGVDNRTVNMAILRRRYTTPQGLALLFARLWVGTYHLVRLARRHHIRLVHSNSSAVLCGAFASAITRIPHIWYVREIVQAPPLVRRTLAHLIAWRSDRVVVNSHAVGAHLIQDAPGVKDRLVVIPPPVDMARFNPKNDGRAVRREWGVADDEVLFGVVGRIHWWKGQDVFLQAAALVAQRLPNARFVIVGDVVPGEEELRHRLQEMARRLGLEDKVVWAGYRKDAPQVMAALDVLVLASTSPEPFGRVIIEAMATAKPVIATAHGGPLEIVRDGETGFLVTPRDPQHMAEAMIRLGEDPELRRRMGEAGLERIYGVYTLEKHIVAFEQLYEEVLSER